jgi:hypothetical protein
MIEKRSRSGFEVAARHELRVRETPACSHLAEGAQLTLKRYPDH